MTVRTAWWIFRKNFYRGFGFGCGILLVVWLFGHLRDLPF